MKRYVKRPIEVEAIQFTGDLSAAEILEWAHGVASLASSGMTLNINTLEGTMRAIRGDWIVKGTHGEFYPVNVDIFAETYEEVTDERSG